MDETEVNTRQGLILEGVLASALKLAGFSAEKDFQYSSSCEVPDFLIPDGKRPQWMLEVHQTRTWNSFRMKLLRAFTAVAEAKAHFGAQIVSVNILFGDPDREIPTSNVRAMCGIFDENIFLRRDLPARAKLEELEKFSRSLASKELLSTEKAAARVISQCSSTVSEIARLLKDVLPKAKPRPDLAKLWRMETSRVGSLPAAPRANAATYYKRCMQFSLFFSDEDFAELLKKRDPNKCSPSTQSQLVATRLASVSEELDGDHYVLGAEMDAFLKDKNCAQLRAFAASALGSEESLKWYFEDIRDARRRNKMCDIALRLFDLPSKAMFVNEFLECFLKGTYKDIQHSRAWIADLLPLALGRSHNFFNGKLFRSPKYPLTLANPYQNITIRSPRMKATSPDVLRSVAEVAEIIWNFSKTHQSPCGKEELSRRFLRFRQENAIKLKKMDPFHWMMQQTFAQYGIVDRSVTVANLMSDLSNDPIAALFRVKILESGAKRALFTAVAVHDGHGDDKSKEWGARRLATLYRMESGKIRKSEYQEGIFVLDGEWKDKDVARLYRSGWNHVVRLADLETTLRSVFGIKKSSIITPSRLAVPVSGPEDEEDLAMAAEDAKPSKLKRKGGRG